MKSGASIPVPNLKKRSPLDPVIISQPQNFSFRGRAAIVIISWIGANGERRRQSDVLENRPES
jgi:hypothetical protein